MKSFRKQHGFLKPQLKAVQVKALGYGKDASSITLVEALVVGAMLAYFAGCFYAVFAN